MAAIDDLIQQITDPVLRERIQQEVNRMAKQKKFGLVFEEHLPECTPLYDMPVKRGSSVALKTGKVSDIYIVQNINNGTASCIKKDSREQADFPIDNLVCVAEFGEPIYPYLKPIDAVCNAPESNLWHTLIEADNYHALQLLEYLYAGKVDCIYIDPPYNTGARDWKYNNDYVDENDSYRHSKWLSFMEKRLRIAKQLLNPKESALIIAIDEKEYLHLGCLLEELFADADIEMVTSVVNARGKHRSGKFAKTEEYIFFIKIGSSTVLPENDPDYREGADVPWRTLRRSSLAGARGRHGPGACGPNQFFPIFINDKGQIEEIGTSIPEDLNISKVNARMNCIPVFPIRNDGTEMNWGITDALAKQLWKKGFLRVGRFFPDRPQQWEISYLTAGKIEDIETGRAQITGYNPDGSVKAVYIENKLKFPSSVWMKPSHNAETGGTNLLKKLFKDNNFPYPKSLFAVKDCLGYFLGNKKGALIVDFFAGSGTTLHAVNLLNAEDGGQRRCIMVTNNEVSDTESNSLRQSGYQPGDEEWEKLGIARHVTWPRTVCSIKGHDVNGNPLRGDYGTYHDEYVLDEEKKGRYKKIKNIPDNPLLAKMQMADGFKANAAFFKLGFLDKTSVALGRQFRELLPVLWMKAGCIGTCPALAYTDLPDMLILPENSLAILIDERAFPKFEQKLRSHPEIETVFIITDSEAGYREMISGLQVKDTYQLYRDYLDNFRINTGR